MVAQRIAREAADGKIARSNPWRNHFFYIRIHKGNDTFTVQSNKARKKIKAAKFELNL